MGDYGELKRRLARGWNTWNTRSVLSHVLLPEGLALNLGLKEYRNGQFLREALIGRQGAEDEQIRPGPHAYDGSYSALTLQWRDIELQVESATQGGDLALLLTPLAMQKRPATLIAEAALLWDRPGYASREDGAIVARLPQRTVPIYAAGKPVPEPNVAASGPYFALALDGAVGISTGRPRNLDEIRALVGQRRSEHEARAACYGGLRDLYEAIQTSLAWDTIYDPQNERVVTPVSRIWNCNWGGCVLFCWDNYFAAYLASLDNRDLAYANAIEITRTKTERGFVPNFAAANGVKSRDRSQPPVGSLVVRELYRRYGDRWLLEELFADLLTWNRWWPAHREADGLLAWGSDPYEPVVGNYWETAGVNERFGAALESGLDNSPMYDDVPFDAEAHHLKLQDAGLTSLYILDCRALADIARILGRAAEAAELQARAGRYAGNLQALWDERSGIFRNRRTDTGELSPRLSPTLFYPLLAGAATPQQAQRMVGEHLTNPAEFWGDWVLPSIARDDPAYPEQTYWRGRIWAPMNFLVYLGLRHYDLPQARAGLAQRSRSLLLKEWRERGHVHENYSADTGEGCDRPNSDRFYHWGSLLGIIAFLEEGLLGGPEKPLEES